MEKGLCVMVLGDRGLDWWEGGCVPLVINATPQASDHLSGSRWFWSLCLSPLSPLPFSHVLFCSLSLFLWPVSGLLWVHAKHCIRSNSPRAKTAPAFTWLIFSPQTSSGTLTILNLRQTPSLSCFYQLTALLWIMSVYLFCPSLWLPHNFPQRQNVCLLLNELITA